VIRGLLALAAASSLVLLSGCGDTVGSGILHVGQPAPHVKTKNLADVGGDLGKITTYHWPNPLMYKYTEMQALAMHKPIIIEFATPAHCTECDEEMEMLKMVMARFGSQIVVLHMDQYYNPESYRVFQVRGEPWTVVIDKYGIVRRIWPGRTLRGEIAPVIATLVKEPYPKPKPKVKPAEVKGKGPAAPAQPGQKPAQQASGQAAAS